MLRYREALWAGYQSIRYTRSITTNTVIEVYQRIKDTPLKLRSPQSQVVIRRGNSEFRSGEIIYTQPGLLNKGMNRTSRTTLLFHSAAVHNRKQFLEVP